jgi:hypothetical protein
VTIPATQVHNLGAKDVCSPTSIQHYPPLLPTDQEVGTDLITTIHTQKCGLRLYGIDLNIPGIDWDDSSRRKSNLRAVN